MDDTDSKTNITTDRETIRTWAEDTGTKPGYRTTASGERELIIYHPDEKRTDVEDTTWGEFFDQMDNQGLALVRHTDRVRSNQFELVERTEAIERAALDDEAVEQSLMEGETIETEITETKVVERTVQETETIESEVVDTELVREDTVDTELVHRELSDLSIGDEGRGITIVENGEVTDFGVQIEDVDVAEQETITINVTETRERTRELIERKTVESEVVDRDVEGTETVESDTLEGRVDLEGVHRTIVESDLLGGDVISEDVEESEQFESEFTDDETIVTELYQRRLVVDELVDRKQITFDRTSAETLTTETVDSRTVETELLGSDAVAEYVEGARVTTGTEAEQTATETEAGPITLDDHDVGKDVIDSTGENVGVVTEVNETENRMFVDPDPGLAQRIKATLGWEDHDEDAYTIEARHVAEISGNEIRLREL